MGILVRCHSAKYRPQSGTTFPACFCSLPHNPWMEIMPTVSRTDSRAQILSAQTSACICGARWELEILFSWPQAVGQEERRGKARRISVFSFGNASAQKSQGRQCPCFRGNKACASGGTRPRAVCSFGTSKPIHLKMWPLPFWLPHCALDSPVLFKRKALLGWGPLKCILWSAVSQKICPSWLCSVIIVSTVISVPIGWVR